MPIEFLLVNSLDTLQQCENALNDVTEVGWDCEGVDLSRFGKLCIIQFATSERCFILDVLCAAKESILAYAKEVLENPGIVKVIHDVRNDSDALWHGHGIRVCIVHDTQAWHQIICRTQEIKVKLNTVLIANGLKANVVRDSSVYETNPRFWETRPLGDMALQWAAGDVSLLLELRQKQLKSASDEEQSQAKALSEEKVEFRTGITSIVQIPVGKVGLFIGKGGSNIRFLSKMLNVELQGFGFKNSGNFAVYAHSQTELDKATTYLGRFNR